MACENELAALTFAVGQLAQQTAAALVASNAAFAKAQENLAAATVARDNVIALVAGVNVAMAAMNAYNGCLLGQGLKGPAVKTSCSFGDGMMSPAKPSSELATMAEQVAKLQRQIDSLIAGT